MNLVWVAIAIFLINIPFGYWRAGVKRLSLYWFLAIHIPVPFIILFRYLGGVGYELYTYVIFVSVFFAGQKVGELLFKNKEQCFGKSYE